MNQALSQPASTESRCTPDRASGSSIDLRPFLSDGYSVGLA
jgi:hypothetical protein